MGRFATLISLMVCAFLAVEGTPYLNDDENLAWEKINVTDPKIKEFLQRATEEYSQQYLEPYDENPIVFEGFLTKAKIYDVTIISFQLIFVPKTCTKIESSQCAGSNLVKKHNCTALFWMNNNNSNYSPLHTLFMLSCDRISTESLPNPLEYIGYKGVNLKHPKMQEYLRRITEEYSQIYLEPSNEEPIVLQEFAGKRKILNYTSYQFQLIFAPKRCEEEEQSECEGPNFKKHNCTADFSISNLNSNISDLTLTCNRISTVRLLNPLEIFGYKGINIRHPKIQEFVKRTTEEYSQQYLDPSDDEPIVLQEFAGKHSESNRTEYAIQLIFAPITCIKGEMSLCEGSNLVKKHNCTAFLRETDKNSSYYEFRLFCLRISIEPLLNPLEYFGFKGIDVRDPKIEEYVKRITKEYSQQYLEPSDEEPIVLEELAGKQKVFNIIDYRFQLIFAPKTCIKKGTSQCEGSNVVKMHNCTASLYMDKKESNESKVLLTCDRISREPLFNPLEYLGYKGINVGQPEIQEYVKHITKEYSQRYLETSDEEPIVLQELAGKREDINYSEYMIQLIFAPATCKEETSQCEGSNIKKHNCTGLLFISKKTIDFSNINLTCYRMATEPLFNNVTQKNAGYERVNAMEPKVQEYVNHVTKEYSQQYLEPSDEEPIVFQEFVGKRNIYNETEFVLQIIFAPKGCKREETGQCEGSNDVKKHNCTAMFLVNDTDSSYSEWQLICSRISTTPLLNPLELFGYKGINITDPEIQEHLKRVTEKYSDTYSETYSETDFETHLSQTKDKPSILEGLAGKRKLVTLTEYIFQIIFVTETCKKEITNQCEKAKVKEDNCRVLLWTSNTYNNISDIEITCDRISNESLLNTEEEDQKILEYVNLITEEYSQQYLDPADEKPIALQALTGNRIISNATQYIFQLILAPERCKEETSQCEGSNVVKMHNCTATFWMNDTNSSTFQPSLLCFRISTEPLLNPLELIGYKGINVTDHTVEEYAKRLTNEYSQQYLEPSDDEPIVVERFAGKRKMHDSIEYIFQVIFVPKTCKQEDPSQCEGSNLVKKHNCTALFRMTNNNSNDSLFTLVCNRISTEPLLNPLELDGYKGISVTDPTIKEYVKRVTKEYSEHYLAPSNDEPFVFEGVAGKRKIHSGAEYVFQLIFGYKTCEKEDTIQCQGSEVVKKHTCTASLKINDKNSNNYKVILNCKSIRNESSQSLWERYGFQRINVRNPKIQEYIQRATKEYSQQYLEPSDEEPIVLREYAKERKETDATRYIFQLIFAPNGCKNEKTGECKGSNVVKKHNCTVTLWINHKTNNTLQHSLFCFRISSEPLIKPLEYVGYKAVNVTDPQIQKLMTRAKEEYQQYLKPSTPSESIVLKSFAGKRISGPVIHHKLQLIFASNACKEEETSECKKQECSMDVNIDNNSEDYTKLTCSEM